MDLIKISDPNSFILFFKKIPTLFISKNTQLHFKRKIKHTLDPNSFSDLSIISKNEDTLSVFIYYLIIISINKN